MLVYYDPEQLPDFNNTVITIGSFDGVHSGHRQILNRLCGLAHSCKCTSVVITFDPHPRTVLNPADTNFQLLSSTTEKIEMIRACGIDVLVVIPFTAAFSRMPAEEYVESFLKKRFNPRYIVIGYDHRFGANREGNIQFLKQYEIPGSCEIVEIDKQEIDALAISSSKIREAIKKGNLDLANTLLGQPYSFTGTVVQGDQIGRTIGFPTANLETGDPLKLIPAPGIYAARAFVHDIGDNGMLYIGVRPGLDVNHAHRIEMNLFDFDGDLYGRELRIEVLTYLRPDAAFVDLEALQRQIEADKCNALQFFEKQRAPHAVRHENVAIVILNYNTRKQLEAFLPAVLNCSPGAAIVVADNGSPDDSIAFLEANYPEVRVIDLKTNFGFAEGYNQALALVDAEFYVILNSDVEVTPGWLDAPIRTMQHSPAIGVVQPKIKAWRQKTHFEYAGASGGWIDRLGYPFCRGRIFSHTEPDTGQYDNPQECFWAAGAAFFIRKSLYHKLGGFDGDYFAHNEEIDLCWRLKRAGYSVWCIPESVVYHVGGGTLEYENPRKVFLNFRNSLFTLVKNAPFPNLIWLIAARLLLDGLAGCRFLAKGQFRAIFAVIRAHFSFYGSMGMLIKKRKAASNLVKLHGVSANENTSGYFRSSIVWKYYGEGVHIFSKLNIK